MTMMKHAAGSGQQAAGTGHRAVDDGSRRIRLARYCLLPAACCLLLTSCYKDDLDPAALTNNPFDPGYNGPAIFTFDTTYVEVLTTFPLIQRQVFQFHVNSGLFLAEQAYSVRVHDQVSGTTSMVEQVPGGSDVLRYYRLEFTHGQEYCMGLTLSNNTHDGRTETVCGFLP